MAAIFTGTMTVSTCAGHCIAFGTSDNLDFRARSFYISNLNTSGAIWLDLTTTSGCSTGFQVQPGVNLQFPQLGGIRGFSAIASTAGGSVVISYLGSR